MIITLAILNLLDYTLTLLNRGNFEEANPLIPLNIAIAMLMQRYVFRDKGVSGKAVKSKFKEAFQKGDKK